MDTKLHAPYGRTSRRMAQETLSSTLLPRSTTYWMLISCSLLLSLVLFVSCGSQANSLSTTINPNVKAITDILSAYCTAITNHDDKTIGKFVRLPLGHHYTPDVFAALLHAIQVRYKDVTRCTVGSVTLSADGQTATGRVSYMLAHRTVLNVDYNLTKYKGKWALESS